MKIFLTILVTCVLILGQNINAENYELSGNYITEKIEADTTYISEEELFLKKISDEALAKEEKRGKITNKILAIIIIYLLVDRIINK